MRNMKKTVYSLLFLFLFSSDTFVAKGQKVGDREWKLVFSGEFNQKNGSQPDPTKWVRCIRCNAGWNRWISNSKEVVYIKNGQLICRTIPNTTEPKC